jgi:hypothetical protein
MRGVEPRRARGRAPRTIVRVEDERAKGLIDRRRRRRNALHDRLEDLRYSQADLCGGGDGVGAVEADGGLDLRGTVVDVGSGEVDLVQHGNDLQVVVQREEHVGDGLRLDSLRGVDDEQRALARGQRARDLVLEVDVAGRVDQIQHIPLAVLREIVHAGRLQLDRDAALALDVHIVQKLSLHLALLHRLGRLQQPVSERGLSMVNVRDDAKITNALRIVHAKACCTVRC